MIVVDTNTIAYFFPTKFTDSVEQVLILNAHWVAPTLWHSDYETYLQPK